MEICEELRYNFDVESKQQIGIYEVPMEIKEYKGQIVMTFREQLFDYVKKKYKADPEYYDIGQAFENADEIDWKQGAGIIAFESAASDSLACAQILLRYLKNGAIYDNTSKHTLGVNGFLEK